MGIHRVRLVSLQHRVLSFSQRFSTAVVPWVSWGRLDQVVPEWSSRSRISQSAYRSQSPQLVLIVLDDPNGQKDPSLHQQKSPHQFNNQTETRAINQGSYQVGPGQGGPAANSQHKLNQHCPTGQSPPPQLLTSLYLR